MRRMILTFFAITELNISWMVWYEGTFNAHFWSYNIKQGLVLLEVIAFCIASFKPYLDYVTKINK